MSSGSHDHIIGQRVTVYPHPGSGKYDPPQDKGVEGPTEGTVLDSMDGVVVVMLANGSMATRHIGVITFNDPAKVLAALAER